MVPDLMIAPVFGYLAAFCTTVAFVPQALKAWRTRSVEDLSLVTFLLFTAGVACWLIYGIMTVDWPIIAANVVTLALAASILTMRVMFGGRAAPAPGHDE
jgi:MtN3 and saliva related transmembrane protein